MITFDNNKLLITTKRKLFKKELRAIQRSLCRADKYFVLMRS